MSDEASQASVTIFTQAHRYDGAIVNRGFRLADLLTDSSTSSIELHDAVVVSSAPARSELRSERVLLRKQDILLAIPPEEHEAPVRRKNNRVEKRRFAVALTLSHAIVSGVTQLPHRTARELLLSDSAQLADFLAVMEGKVHWANLPQMPDRCHVMLVRRSAIEAIQFFEELPATPGLLREELARS